MNSFSYFFVQPKTTCLTVSFLFTSAFLDHSSQPRREKESNRSQYAHQDKHPEEYPVNDHGHVLPVLLHLAETRHKQRGTF